MSKSFSFIVALMFISSLGAQQLQNTKWKTYQPALFDTIFVNFDTDSVKQFDSQENLLVSSWFEEKADTIKVLDGAGPYKCQDPDTGWYNFIIAGNELKIFLLSDSCDNRAIAYDGVVLERVGNVPPPQGLEDLSDKSGVRIYGGMGNLSVDLQVQGVLKIFNLSAQKLNALNLKPGKHAILMESGIYFVRFEAFNHSGILRQRIVIQ